MLKLVASSLIGLAAAAPAADKVMKMPGFDATSFGVVSRSLLLASAAPVLLERAPLRLLRSGCPPPPPPHCACPRLATRPLPPARRRRPASCLVPRPLRLLSAASSSAPLLLDQLSSAPQYSGYLKVDGPFTMNEYDSLSIHYQFHESQGDPKTDPIATVRAPPFCSVFSLLLTRLASSGTRAGRAAPRSTSGSTPRWATSRSTRRARTPTTTYAPLALLPSLSREDLKEALAQAWNKVASMLYLESPAGSGSRNGYSTCVKGGRAVDCEWTDQSQAEACAHTLASFFEQVRESLF